MKNIDLSTIIYALKRITFTLWAQGARLRMSLIYCSWLSLYYGSKANQLHIFQFHSQPSESLEEIRNSRENIFLLPFGKKGSRISEQNSGHCPLLVEWVTSENYTIGKFVGEIWCYLQSCSSTEKPRKSLLSLALWVALSQHRNGFARFLKKRLEMKMP